MSDRDAAARAEILARLCESREELRRRLDPPRQEPDGIGAAGDQPAPDGFPRSRTMRMLMSGGGVGTLGAVAAGLLIARPALALRLLRMLPVGAFAKMLVSKALTALRTKPEPPR